MNVPPATVQAAASGSAPALDQIVRALQGPLYNLSLRMLSSHEDAEEATQEALLRVITHLSTFRGESRFSTWAWRIATRVVLAFRQRRARLPLSIEDFAADLAEGADPDATERIEDAVLLRQVKIGCGRAMLSCLSDEQRLAYILGEILDITGPEAAEILDVSPATFRKRLSRARERVTENLQRTCGVVQPDAPCRCHRRIRPAQERGRLHPRDADGALVVPALRAQLAALHAIQRDRAFYRADPHPEPPVVLRQRIRAHLGLG